jgi:hypothetical protein
VSAATAVELDDTRLAKLAAIGQYAFMDVALRVGNSTSYVAQVGDSYFKVTLTCESSATSIHSLVPALKVDIIDITGGSAVADSMCLVNDLFKMMIPRDKMSATVVRPTFTDVELNGVMLSYFGNDGDSLRAPDGASVHLTCPTGFYLKHTTQPSDSRARIRCVGKTWKSELGTFTSLPGPTSADATTGLQCVKDERVTCSAKKFRDAYASDDIEKFTFTTIGANGATGELTDAAVSAASSVVEAFVHCKSGSISTKYAFTCTNGAGSADWVVLNNNGDVPAAPIAATDICTARATDGCTIPSDISHTILASTGYNVEAKKVSRHAVVTLSCPADQAFTSTISTVTAVCATNDVLKTSDFEGALTCSKFCSLPTAINLASLYDAYDKPITTETRFIDGTQLKYGCETGASMIPHKSLFELIPEHPARPTVTIECSVGSEPTDVPKWSTIVDGDTVDKFSWRRDTPNGAYGFYCVAGGCEPFSAALPVGAVAADLKITSHSVAAFGQIDVSCVAPYKSLTDATMSKYTCHAVHDRVLASAVTFEWRDAGVDGGKKLDTKNYPECTPYACDPTFEATGLAVTGPVHYVGHATEQTTAIAYAKYAVVECATTTGVQNVTYGCSSLQNYAWKSCSAADGDGTECLFTDAALKCLAKDDEKAHYCPLNSDFGDSNVVVVSSGLSLADRFKGAEAKLSCSNPLTHRVKVSQLTNALATEADYFAHCTVAAGLASWTPLNAANFEYECVPRTCAVPSTLPTGMAMSVDAVGKFYTLRCIADDESLTPALPQFECLSDGSLQTSDNKIVSFEGGAVEFDGNEVKCRPIFHLSAASIVGPSTVQVKLSQSVTAEPKYIQSTKCGDYLAQSSVALLGNEPECWLSDSETFTITLGTDFILRPFSVLVFKPDVFVMDFLGQKVNVKGDMTEVSTVTVKTLVVKTDAPSTCSNYVLDISGSTGGAGRKLRFAFTLPENAAVTDTQNKTFLALVAKKLPVLRTSFRSDNSPQPVGRLELTAVELASVVTSGPFAIVATATNWMGNSHSFTHTFSVTNDNVPAVIVATPSLSTSRSKPVENIAFASLSPCAPTGAAVSVSWSLASGPAGIIPTMPAAGVTKLSFAAGALAAGTYTFRATATQTNPGAAAVSSQASFTLVIAETLLVPVIVGAPVSTYNRNLASAFVLDGSKSYDSALVSSASASDGISYSWTCEVGDTPCTVSVPLNTAVVTLPAADVEALDSATAIFTLTVSKTGVAAVSSTVAVTFDTAAALIITDAVSTTGLPTVSAGVTSFIQPSNANLVLRANVLSSGSYSSVWHCTGGFSLANYAVGAYKQSTTLTVSRAAFSFAKTFSCTFYASAGAALPTTASGLAALPFQRTVSVTVHTAPAAAVCTSTLVGLEYLFKCAVPGAAPDQYTYVITKTVAGAASLVVSQGTSGSFITTLAAGTHTFRIVATDAWGTSTESTYTMFAAVSSATPAYLTGLIASAVMAGNGQVFVSSFADMLSQVSEQSNAAGATTERAQLLTTLSGSMDTLVKSDAVSAVPSNFSSPTAAALIKEILSVPAQTNSALRVDAIEMLGEVVAALKADGVLTRSIAETAVAAHASAQAGAVANGDVKEATYAVQRLAADLPAIVAGLLNGAPEGASAITTSGSVAITAHRMSTAAARSLFGQSSVAVSVSADFFDGLIARGITVIDVASMSLSSSDFLAQVGADVPAESVSPASGLKFFTTEGQPIDTSSINTVRVTIKHAGLTSELHNFPSCQFLVESAVEGEPSENKLWSTEGCRVRSHSSTQTICECSHLTVFRARVGSPSQSGDSWLELNSSNVDDNMTPLYVVIVWIAAALVFCAAVKVYDSSKKGKAAQQLALQWNTGKSPVTPILPEDASACDFIIRRTSLTLSDYHLLFSVFTRSVLDTVASTPRMFGAMVVYLSTFAITAMFWGGKSSRFDLENYGGVIFLAAVTMFAFALIVKVILSATHTKSSVKSFVYCYSYEVAKLYSTGSSSFFTAEDQERLLSRRKGHEAGYAQIVREFEAGNEEAAHAVARQCISIDVAILQKTLRQHDVQTSTAAAAAYAFFLAWCVGCSVIIVAFGIQLGNTVDTTFGKWIGSAFAAIGVEALIVSPVCYFLVSILTVGCSAKKSDALPSKRDRALTIVENAGYAMPVKSAGYDYDAPVRADTGAVAIPMPETAAHDGDDEDFVASDIYPTFSAAPAAAEENDYVEAAAIAPVTEETGVSTV